MDEILKAVTTNIELLIGLVTVIVGAPAAIVGVRKANKTVQTEAQKAAKAEADSVAKTMAESQARWMSTQDGRIKELMEKVDEAKRDHLECEDRLLDEKKQRLEDTMELRTRVASLERRVSHD